MADLTTLIRLHKHELDEKRQALAVLNEQLVQLERQRHDFERDFEREKEAARVSGDINFTFSGYVAQAGRLREEMDGLKSALETKVAAAKDSMMETFSELKKYEKAEAERARLAAAQRTLKETKELDDIGLETFRRKSEE